MTMDEQHNEPWTYKRLRYRLNTLIEVLPTAVAGDQQTRTLLKNVHEDLREILNGLDQWHGEGIFSDKERG